jgi:hypothetical protein
MTAGFIYLPLDAVQPSEKKRETGDTSMSNGQENSNDDLIQEPNTLQEPNTNIIQEPNTEFMQEPNTKNEQEPNTE